MDLQETNPAILFLHDGELAELREPLSTLGTGVAERDNGPSPEDRAHPWDLVLASSKRMLALDSELRERTGVRIAVLDGDSKTLRAMLRRAGTDLLVRRPVHPAALRLLILHSLYHGPEKRRSSRVSIGAAVRFRSGLRRRNAILAELSPTGCRMLAPAGSYNAKTGSSLTLQLPGDLCGGRTLAISGRVLRIEDENCGTNAIAVNFTKLRPSVAEKLRSVIAAHADGPAMLHSEAAFAPDSSSRLDEPESVPIEPGNAAADLVSAPSDANPERRQQPRHNLERRVIALGEQASRVLMGRDLSVGGMRVGPAPGLEIGNRLKIALHVQANRQPVVVDVEIARDDGQDGLGLRFVNLDPEQLKLITRMVGSLHPISEPDDPEESAGVFVSEVLKRQSG